MNYLHKNIQTSLHLKKDITFIFILRPHKIGDRPYRRNTGMWDLRVSTDFLVFFISQLRNLACTCIIELSSALLRNSITRKLQSLRLCREQCFCIAWSATEWSVVLASFRGIVMSDVKFFCIHSEIRSWNAIHSRNNHYGRPWCSLHNNTGTCLHASGEEYMQYAA